MTQPQNTWTVEIHRAKEGGYWGEVPALPGCASFGATRAECRRNVIEAARGCLEVYVEEAMREIRRRPSTRPPAKVRVYA
ncbi:MAG: type II toxin-antitoxin system HicB family antitoxin [Kiritimatiellia bacterium]